MKNTPPLDSPAQKANIGSNSEYRPGALSLLPWRYNPPVMMVGQTISHYKLVSQLGKGGMGVVYKAEDTQLRRTVALKFLPRETLDEEEVKARLLREAQAAASLDHPNICQVFGIHEEDGETFIAMAYIDGPSLAEKIKERPLPLDEALTIAVQIAEGVHEAHEQGVVHRDIKPQNILLNSKGQVKILDFGLASLTGRSKLTKTGTMLGTPAYMAPEQLEGKEVDRRADIWALGCVLYEMLTQKTPFDAEYEQAIGYGILNEDPEPASAQRADVSPEVDRLLSKTLAKEPAERYQHADDLLAELRVLRNSSTAPKRAPRSSPPGTVTLPSWQLRLERGLLALAALAALGLAALYFSTPTGDAPVDRNVRHFSFAPTDGVRTDSYSTDLAISPNGRYIAFVAGSADRRLRIPDLEQQQARAIEGTEGARGPFWSPVSDFIGFATNLELKKVSIQGAATTQLCELPNNNFFFWGGGPGAPTAKESSSARALRRSFMKCRPVGGGPTR